MPRKKIENISIWLLTTQRLALIVLHMSNDLFTAEEQAIDNARAAMHLAQHYYENSGLESREACRKEWAQKEQEYKALMFKFTAKLD